MANYDEDSITMAVAVALDCLHGCSRGEIGGFSLSSTTVPYLDRQNAAICSAALVLRPDIRTADFGASLKSGTTALISACDTVKAGDITKCLVCVADSRQGKPGSNMEHTFGDGTAAILVGADDVIADRSADIIKYKGCRISCSEIEATLQDHEAVIGACVVGVSD